MAADSAEDSGLSPLPNPEEEVPKGVLEELPWLDYAIERVQFLRGTVDETYGIARTRVSDIGYTSSAHLQQSVADLGNFLEMQEREGILVAASQPTLSCGVAMGLGIFALKRPRRYLFRSTMRLFMSREYDENLDGNERLVHASSLSSAEIKVNMMRKSIDVMKLERQKLEERALMAKNQMEWGKTELRKTSNQIQGIVHSIYNIERQARGLKSILQQFPRRQRSQILSKLHGVSYLRKECWPLIRRLYSLLIPTVSSLPYEVQKEKKSLDKMLSRICDHRIST